MLNFKSIQAAGNVLTCTELMHMICKGSLLLQGRIKLSFVDRFYDSPWRYEPLKIGPGVAHNALAYQYWFQTLNWVPAVHRKVKKHQ